MVDKSDIKHTSPNITAKREKIKRKIASQIIPVFLEKGYENTTIKEIENVTGLKAGSIYNLFEDKYDILRECFVLIYSSAFELSRQNFKEDTDVVESIALPLALELYATSSDTTIAQLIDDGYRSRSIMEEIIRMKIQWIRDFTEFTSTPIDDAMLRHNMLAVVGAISNFTSEYHYNPHTDYSKELHTVLTIFCTLFHIPCNNIDDIVKNTVKKLGTDNFNLNIIQTCLDITNDKSKPLQDAQRNKYAYIKK